MVQIRTVTPISFSSVEDENTKMVWRKDLPDGIDPIDILLTGVASLSRLEKMEQSPWS